MVLYNGAQQLSNQISNVVTTIPALYESSLYINNFRDFINYKPIIDNDSNKLIVNSVEELSLTHISFSYKSNNNLVLNDINLSIKKNECIAFVGKNGVGKSTLIKLITRLYDPQVGEIKINGINYNNFNVCSLREKIGVVFQDYQIFAFSIAENILMRKITNKDKDEALIIDALKFVGMYEKIINLPNGIYTNLTTEFSSDGIILSGGELQKIALARAYVKKSEILILDEPSSSMDAITENEIYKTMMKMTKNKIGIFVTHHLFLAKNVNKIYFIENGKIIEEGTHLELMQLNGKYAYMFNLQAEKYI